MRASLILLFGKTKASFGKDTARKKTEMCVCLQPLGIAASGANIRTRVTNFATLHTVTQTFILSHGHQNASF